MFAKAQSPIEEHTVRDRLGPPSTGMIIHWWCAKPIILSELCMRWRMTWNEWMKIWNDIKMGMEKWKTLVGWNWVKGESREKLQKSWYYHQCCPRVDIKTRTWDASKDKWAASRSYAGTVNFLTRFDITKWDQKTSTSIFRRERVLFK